MDASAGGTSIRRGWAVDDDLPPGFLSALPASARQRLLANAVRINVPAGALVYRDSERPRVVVVLQGLLRVFLSSRDGREVTVRYVRRGDVAGLAPLIGGPAPMSIQALTSALVASLRVDELRSLLESDPRVARACAQELARQLYQVLGGLFDQAFLTVRQRIALELLNLADPAGPRRLVVHASHESLAEAVASSREVVTRNLHRLRDAGLVEVSHETIVVVDPIGLAGVAGGRAGS